MPDCDGYIAGVPCWIDTSQSDPDAAAEFYGGLFGLEFEDAMPAGASGRYLIARLRAGECRLNDPSARPVLPCPPKT